MPMVSQRAVMKRGVTHRGDGSTNFHGQKNGGGSWFAVAHNTTSGHGQNPDGRKLKDIEGYERDHPAAFGWKIPRTSSHSARRKLASAMIAKIPLPLARHIAAVWKPRESAPHDRSYEALKSSVTAL